MFGGAAGGGKSDALLVESLRQVATPEYRAIIFRRKTKQLRKLTDRSFEIIPKIIPQAVWKESEKTWCFPSGAKLMLWHMEEEKHKYDHDGQEYHFIGFDELTHFSLTQYQYLYSRCRTAVKGIRCYIRSSAMPMGAGISWVKQRFIDNGPNVVIEDKDTGLERIFIPSKLDDNRILMDNDPAYEQRLKLMGPKLYRALRQGDWNVIEGACFEELDDVHKIAPEKPYDGALVWRSLDWGYAKPFSVGWYYKNFDDHIIRFMELYGCQPGESDKGLKMDSREVAKKILAIEGELGLRISYGKADPAIWSKVDGSPSIAENMALEGVHWEPAINDRIQGKMELHSRLSTAGDGPSLYVTENCTHWWRTVPLLQVDPKRPEDVDTKMEDHIYDETRYSLMSQPCYGSITSEPVLGTERDTANQSFI